MIWELLGQLTAQLSWGGLSKKFFEISNFLTNISTYNAASCNRRVFENYLNQEKCQTANQFGVAEYSKSTTRQFKYDVNEASLLHRLPMEIERADVQHNYIFDYCFIMSKANYGWIQCFLQHQLRIQMIDGDSNFSGSNKINDIKHLQS